MVLGADHDQIANYHSSPPHPLYHKNTKLLMFLSRWRGVVIGAHGQNRTNNILWPTHAPTLLYNPSDSIIPCSSAVNLLRFGNWDLDLMIKRGPPPTTFVANFLGPPPYLWLPISFGVILSSWRVVLIYHLFFLICFSQVFFPLLIFFSSS
jgi:hypothetical protein